MGRAWTTRDGERCREIAAELSVMRMNGAPVLDTALAEIRDAMAVETMLIYTPALRINGWELVRYHSSGFANNTKLRRLFTDFLAATPSRFALYDPARPEPDQRDRILEPLTAPDATGQLAPYMRAVFVPMKLEHHRQLRILVCEGTSLLGWFGSLHSDVFEPRHRRMMRALLPALRVRMSIERRLSTMELDRRALELALEQLGAPAFVVNSRGQLMHVNEAGHALLAARGADARRALGDAIAGRTGTMQFAITPLADPGSPPAWLAMLRAQSADDQLSQRVRDAVRRWGLTTRQRSVLQAIVAGQANAAIAALSGTSERAVEQHVTALFDRAGVDNRAALVAAVLLA